MGQKQRTISKCTRQLVYPFERPRSIAISLIFQPKYILVIPSQFYIVVSYHPYLSQ